MRNLKCGGTFVSLEPMLGSVRLGYGIKIDWVIVGAQTHGGKTVKRIPNMAIDDIIKDSKDIGARVFIKNNVGYPVKIQDFPWED